MTTGVCFGRVFLRIVKGPRTTRLMPGASRLSAIVSGRDGRSLRGDPEASAHPDADWTRFRAMGPLWSRDGLVGGKKAVRVCDRAREPW